MFQNMYTKLDSLPYFVQYKNFCCSYKYRFKTSFSIGTPLDSLKRFVVVRENTMVFLKNRKSICIF